MSSSGRGVPLSEAAWRFGSARLRRQVEDVQVEEGPATQVAKSSAGKWPKPGVSKALIELGAALDEMNARSEAWRALREALFARLHAGKLAATGYPVHKEEAGRREAVPAFMFQEQYAKWGKNVFEGQGRRYELVEISKPSIQSEAKSSSGQLAASPSRPVTLVKRSVGRPNVRNRIAELALEIIDDPNTPPWRFRAELQQPVRELGRKRFPDQFDELRPKIEVIRIGINDALKLRPHLLKSQKL